MRSRFVALALAAAGCGPAATDYDRLAAEAGKAYTSGRYDEAAKDWAEAASRAPRNTDRDEARYREAVSLERARRGAEAATTLDRLLRESPSGTRAARAAYDHAVLTFDSGDVEKGYRELEVMIRTYPDSGVAPAALTRYLDSARARGESAVRAVLDALIPQLEKTELGQSLHYAYASSLERDGNLAAARARYLLVAERYPYPGGALWDDSLYHAADLDARLGDPRAAIARLESMLSKREAAFFQGSYERGRYAEAAYRIAELYRDALGDPVRARQAFERLFATHRQSRLRDDAEWNAARLAAAAGDAPGACRDLRALIAELPASRFVACAPRLCAELPRIPGTECHDYLVRPERNEAEDPAP